MIGTARGSAEDEGWRVRKGGVRFWASVSQLMPMAGKYKHGVKFVVAALAFACVVLSVANPQIGTKLEEVKREGVDIMIALVMHTGAAIGAQIGVAVENMRLREEARDAEAICGQSSGLTPDPVKLRYTSP